MTDSKENPIKEIMRSAERAVVWDTGVIKWFDQKRRWGFIVPDENGPDVFLPWTVLQECAIRERDASPGVAVRFRWVPADRPGHRPKATHLMLRKVSRS